ncbi:acyl-CoA thioesterase [Microbacterium sp. SLBN-154]|nr:acyl-CoA thioesterase [Microbacterium sp. SLBN-154]
MRRMLEQDRTFHAFGMEVIVDEPGRAVIRMPVRDDMTNGFAITHGGVVFALADTAFAVACNEPDGPITVSVGADIVFFRSTRPGDVLTAEAHHRVTRGRTGLYDVTVTDAEGAVVAEFRGHARRTDRRLDDA